MQAILPPAKWLLSGLWPRCLLLWPWTIWNSFLELEHWCKSSALILGLVVVCIQPRVKAACTSRPTCRFELFSFLAAFARLLSKVLNQDLPNLYLVVLRLSMIQTQCSLEYTERQSNRNTDWPTTITQVVAVCLELTTHIRYTPHNKLFCRILSRLGLSLIRWISLLRWV